MRFSDLKINKAKRTKKTRIGRGTGSGMGKTAAKGHKGQKARSGVQIKPWFEGGQQRFTQRVPKSGFKNFFRISYQTVNVGMLEAKFDNGATVDKASMIAKRLISKKNMPVKVLGDGDLKKSLKVKADKLSKSAAEKIVKAGGEVLA